MARSLVFYYFEDKEMPFRGGARYFLDRLRRLFAANDPSAERDPRVWLRREVEIFLDIMAAHSEAMSTIGGQGCGADLLARDADGHPERPSVAISQAECRETRPVSDRAGRSGPVQHRIAEVRACAPAAAETRWSGSHRGDAV